MLMKISREDPKVILESCENKYDVSDQELLENFMFQIEETKRIVRSYCDFMKAPMEQNEAKTKKNLT